MATLNPTVQAGIAGFESGFNNSLRLQQLRSQRAMQQLEERRMVQQMAIVAEQHDLAVQERADMEKAMARVQMQSQEMLPTMADGPAALGGQPPGAFLPNPNYVPLDQSLFQNVLPVVAKYRPGEVDNFVSNVAMLPYRQAMAARAQEQQDFSPHAEPVTMPDGSVLPGIRTSRNAWTPVGTGGPEVQTVNGRQMRRNRFGDWVPMAATPEDVNKRQTAQKFLAESLKLDPSQVKMDEEGNAVITPQAWQSISQLGSVSPSTRSTMEKTILATQVARSAAADALQTIESTPTALGVPGILREWIETGKGLAGSKDTPEVSIARDKLRKDFIKLSEDLKVDVGNLTQYERNKLEQAGDPSRWDQYLSRTKPSMEALLSASASKEFRLLRQLGKDVNDKLLLQLPKDGLQDLYDMGTLTQEDLIKLARMGRITTDQARKIDANKPKG